MQPISVHMENEERDYASLLSGVRGCLSQSHVGGGPLFTTDVQGLWDVFLGMLPEGRRQHYNCRTCRHFVERFGGLVTINEAGHALPAVWSEDAPPFFQASVHAMYALKNWRVTGVFLSSLPMWGLPQNASQKSPSGEWHHLHIVPDARHVRCGSPLKTDDQAMAEKHEEYGMLSRGLAEFPIELVQKAHTLLTSGVLYRSEKCVEIAAWLLKLHEAREATKNKMQRENLVWRAVAAAPVGYAHVRTTMIGTLLEDLAEGKSTEAIKRAFDSKMSPIQYQRPQAAPTDGQLAAAEAVIGKLASAGSLARRFARLEEVLPYAIWTPKPSANPTKGGGVFDHLRSDAKAKQLLEIPAQTITWEKFRRTVLDDAQRIECFTPAHAGGYFAFLTAEDPVAPPILQWDSEERRNPVSWYLYHGGSSAVTWGLSENTYVDVTAVTPQPSQWGRDLAHQGEGAYFVLSGAADQRGTSLGLFPEILRSEYREIRAAIEAYSRSKRPSGKEQASACGLCIQKSGGGGNLQVRVTTKESVAVYRIDRWD